MFSAWITFMRVTPTWDIDNDLANWKSTIEAAKIIFDVLAENGVETSVFFKWSGRGMHVHVHPKAFLNELTSVIHPLDAAFAVVESVRAKVADRLMSSKARMKAGRLEVENRIDVGRVFTVPLSLHRDLDNVSICMKRDDLERFDLNWVSVDKFKHNTGWREFKVGEADDLALRAYEVYGGCPYLGSSRRRRKTKSVEEMLEKFLG